MIEATFLLLAVVAVIGWGVFLLHLWTHKS